MNTEDFEKQAPNRQSPPELIISGVSGFLILGLITGLAIGYLEAIGARQFLGYRHRFNHHWQHFEYLLKCLAIGALVGFLVGYAFDALVRDLRSRRKMVLLWIWLLVIGFVASLLLLPAIQMAR